jgi:hypothetical protein
MAHGLRSRPPDTDQNGSGKKISKEGRKAGKEEELAEEEPFFLRSCLPAFLIHVPGNAVSFGRLLGAAVDEGE